MEAQGFKVEVGTREPLKTHSQRAGPVFRARRGELAPSPQGSPRAKEKRDTTNVRVPERVSFTDWGSGHYSGG